jgi:hypothetical protein
LIILLLPVVEVEVRLQQVAAAQAVIEPIPDLKLRLIHLLQ